VADVEPAGRAMIGATHPAEAYIRQTFGLNSRSAERLAYFLMGHVLLDTRLIALALFRTVSERSKGVGLPLTEIQAIADQLAKGTFGQHLERVSTDLPGDCGQIAGALNDARNALLHWERERFTAVPIYKGLEVTDSEGFKVCMDDIMKFIQQVPFNPGPILE
jgi:hypothetical protein